MKQIFVQQEYKKSTKIQREMEFPVMLELGNVEEPNVVEIGDVKSLEYGEKCFSIIQKKENPLSDFLLESVKFVRETVIDNGDEIVYIPSKSLVHNVIVVKQGVQATIVFDGDENCLVGAEVFVEEGADVKIVLLQMNCADFNFSVIRANVAKKARLTWYLNYLNSPEIYSYIKSDVLGEEGVSDMYVCAYSKEEEMIDLFVGNCFDAKNCKGEIIAKSVGAGKSRLAFVGEIEITLDGGGTDSYLKEDVLMLDETVKIEAVPSLEIKTNDVKAGHGVSIEKLNEERLFYLTSRGISNEKAKNLVLAGFLRDVFWEIGIPEMLDKLEEGIKRI